MTTPPPPPEPYYPGHIPSIDPDQQSLYQAFTRLQPAWARPPQVLSKATRRTPPIPPAVSDFLVLGEILEARTPAILLEHLPTMHRAFPHRRHPIYIDCGCGWIFSDSPSWAIHTTSKIRGDK